MINKITNGNSLKVLSKVEDNLFDSCVTDPPYGINFKGNKWDYDVPSVELWEEAYRTLKPGAYLLAFASPRTVHRMAINIEDAGFEIRDQIMWLYGQGQPKGDNLKPGHEPIVVARKPFEGTIKDNMDKFGTGALNIDESRLEGKAMKWSKPKGGFWKTDGDEEAVLVKNEKGRYPANIIHDGIEETWEKFFYCAKASSKERTSANFHPTVKPVKLMEYLVKLVTPKDGLTLEPFAGSGTTCVAAKNTDRNFVGIELSKEYCSIGMERLA